MKKLNKKERRDNFFVSQDSERVFETELKYREFGWSIVPITLNGNRSPEGNIYQKKNPNNEVSDLFIIWNCVIAESDQQKKKATCERGTYE